MRSAMARELRTAYGNEWYASRELFDDDAARKLATAWSQGGLGQLRDAPDADLDVVEGKLVAEVMFGFWVQLLGKGSYAGRPPLRQRRIYDTLLWQPGPVQGVPARTESTRCAASGRDRPRRPQPRRPPRAHRVGCAATRPEPQAFRFRGTRHRGRARGLDQRRDQALDPRRKHPSPAARRMSWRPNAALPLASPPRKTSDRLVREDPRAGPQAAQARRCGDVGPRRCSRRGRLLAMCLRR